MSKFKVDGRTGAVGALAPVKICQRVHCTRPDRQSSFEGVLLIQKNGRLGKNLVVKIFFIFYVLGKGA